VSVAPFVEGAASIAIPCTLPLLVPGIAVLIAGRLKPAVLAGLFGGLVLGVSARAAGMGEAIGRSAAIPAFALAGGAVLAYIRGWWVAGAMTGFASAMIWRPCVGEALGSILDRGATRPLSAMASTVFFVAGVALVPLGLVLARYVVDGSVPARVARGAVVFSVGMAGTVVLGLHGEILSALARSSV
jgi:hypothetical protein